MDHTPPPVPTSIHAPDVRPEDVPWPVRHLLLPLILPVAVIRGPWRAMPLGRAYLVPLFGLALGCFGLALGDLMMVDPLLVVVPILALASQGVFAGAYMLFLLPVVRGGRFANV